MTRVFRNPDRTDHPQSSGRRTESSKKYFSRGDADKHFRRNQDGSRRFDKTDSAFGRHSRDRGQDRNDLKGRDFHRACDIDARKRLYRDASDSGNVRIREYTDSDSFTDTIDTQETYSVLLCGVKPVRELLESEPARVDTVYIRRGSHGEAAALADTCRECGVRFKLAEPRELARLLDEENIPDGTVRHQGVIARLAATAYIDLRELLSHAADAPLPLIVMADQIRDPGNLGTLARTLYALGGAGLIVPKNNSAFLGTGARRAAAGALEKLPVSRVVNLSRALDEAADAGFHIYGATLTETSTSIYNTSIELPAVLVLGSEKSGIRRQIAERCEKMLHIPMRRKFDSLNVAQAGAICIAECARRYPGTMQ